MLPPEPIDVTKQFPFFKRLAQSAIKVACRQNSADQLFEHFQQWSTFSHTDWLRNIVRVRDVLLVFTAPGAFKKHRNEFKLSEYDARSLMEDFCDFCEWNEANLWPADEDCTVTELQQLTIDSFDAMLKQTFQRALYYGHWTQKLSSLCRSLSMLPSSLQISIDRLKIEDKSFADGGFGSLFRATFRGGQGDLFAVKFMKYQNKDSSKKLWTTIHDEALNLLNLDLPGLNPFLGVTVDPERHLGLVSRYQERGNAVSFLHKSNTIDRIVWVCTVFPLIISAIHQLHYVKLTHGDIKGENILIDESGKACLTDFGLARVAADQSSKGGSSSATGSYHYTLWFCSPERMKSPIGFCSVTDDIWALGMTIVQLLTGKLPFPELLDAQVATALYEERLKLHRSHIPEAVCDKLWELIEGCTEVDTQRRWSSFRVFTAMQSILGDYAIGGVSILLNQ